MRKTLLLFFFFGVLFSLSAQRERGAVETRQRVVQPVASARSVVPDTLFPAILFDTCSLTAANFGVTNGDGFVGGTNNFGDREKAQLIAFPQEVTLQILEVFAFFAAAEEAAASRQVTAKIYSVDETTGGPGTLVATSSPLLVSDINLDDELVVETYFAFPDPPVVTSDGFFVAVDFSDVYQAPSGNVSVFTTRDSCGEGSLAWELWSDNTWHPMDDPNGWSFEGEFFMGVVIDTELPSAVREPLLDLGVDVVPNPARNVASLRFDLPAATSLDVALIDAHGRTVRQRPLVGRQSAGPVRLDLAVADLPAGLYFYRIRTDAGTVSGRLILE